MSLSKKIFLSLLFSSVLIFGLFSYVAYDYDKKKYIEVTKKHFISIAKIQKNRIELFLESFKDRAKLISSRTELSSRTHSYIKFNSEKDLEKINKILLDIKNFNKIIKDIYVVNIDNDLITSTNKNFDNEFELLNYTINDLYETKIDENPYFDKDKRLVFRTVSPILKDEKLVGGIYLEFYSNQLNVIANDYTGLGKTGETVIAKRDSNGALFLTSLRFDKDAALKRKITNSDAKFPMVKALNSDIGFFTNLIDYRNKEVYAATTFIDELDWGIVVKIDKDEIEEDLKALQKELYTILLIIIPIILLISFVVSRNLSSPIVTLTNVARAFEKGDYSFRADESLKNEFGIFAKAFNKMTSRLTTIQKRLIETQSMANLGSWEINLESNSVTLTDEVYKIFEISEEEFDNTYESFINFIHKDDLKIVNEKYTKSLRTNNKYHSIHRIITSKGHIKIVEEIAVHRVDSNGKVIKSFGAILDITKNKEQEKELQELLRVADNHTIMSTTDTRGRIVYASKAFCEISGYSQDELIGKNHRLVRHPDMPKEIYDDLWNSLRQKKIWKGELKNRKKDGGYYWVYLTIGPIYDLEGKIVGYTAIRDDITNKKKIEEAQRIANMGSWELDINTEEINCSKQMLNILEFADDEKQTLDSILELVIDEHKEKIVSKYKKSLEDKNQFHIECDIKTKSNNLKTIEIHAEIEFDNETKKPIKLVGVMLDITERKKIERELYDAKQQAEEAALIKGEFVANMSHEIRTPMNAILGFMDLALKCENLPNDAYDYLLKSKISAKGLLEIINEILDFSKLESKKFTVENICFNIKTLLIEVIELLNYSAMKKEIELISEISEINDCYRGDPLRIKQILINIIGNGIKFTTVGNVKLKVWEEKEHLYFEVSDTGIGIKENQLNKIFEPFVQADSSTVRKFGGTGLGTVISKQLVELMGGEISVQSEYTKGSVFTIKLPLKRAACENNCNIEVQKSSFISSKRVFKILLAEDNKLNAQLIILNLEKELGHEVVWVNNGLKALEEIERRDDYFDLILMDIHMPKMDGLEATRRIRDFESKRIRKIPIVALTASVTKEERKRAQEAGMNGFALKPLMIDDLILEIERVVPLNDSAQYTIKRRYNDIDLENLKELSNIANIKEGLSVWINKDNYIDALLKFIKRHKNDAVQMEKSLNKNDYEEALRVCHTLKGLSLGLRKLQKISSQIYTEIENRKKDINLFALKDEMKKIEQVLSSFEKKEESINRVEKFDKIKLEEDIKHLINLLDAGEFDESLYKKVYEILNSFVDKHELNRLNESLEDFDYEKSIIILKSFLSK